MNRELEIPGRTLIEKLLDGTPCTLDPEQQSLAAGWVLKTALMLGLTRWDEFNHPPDWALRRLRQVARPPASAYVWIGTVWQEDASPGWALLPGGRRFERVWQRELVVVPDRSFVDTFVINRLVAHVFIPDGYPKAITGGIDSDFNETMLRVWPTRAESVEWPPPYHRVYKHLNRLMDRYRWASPRGPGRVYLYPGLKRPLDGPTQGRRE